MGLVYRSLEIIKEEGPTSFLSSVRGSVLYRYRRFMRYIFKIWYGFGSGRVCLICGWEGSKFLSYGVENRPDAECPNCGAKERHRLIWDYFTDNIHTSSSTDILYFAPTKSLEQNLRDNEATRIITVDLTMEDVNINASITELPFEVGSFDILICSHVLEHIPDDETAHKELYRILRPGGLALILVPQNRGHETTEENPEITTEDGCKEAFGHPDHVRLYGRDVREKLIFSGFEVTIDDYVTSLDSEYVEKHRLREHKKWIYDHSLIFLCRKPT